MESDKNDVSIRRIVFVVAFLSSFQMVRQVGRG